MTAARPGVRSVVVNTTMLWLTTAIAATALWPIYRSSSLVVAASGFLLAGSAVAVLGAVFRWPAPAVLFSTVAVFLLLGVPLAVPSEAIGGVMPSQQGLLDLVAAVALGWKQLLTIALPVGSYQALLAPFSALVLAVAVTSLSAALRARRGGIGAFGPVILFVVALAFGPAASRQPAAVAIAQALALLASSLVWMRLRHTGRSTAIGRGRWIRPVLGGASILIIAGGAATAMATVFPPAGERSVLRTSLAQPFNPQDYVSPLSGFRWYWQQPGESDLLFSVTGLPAGARVRIATLDSYNGIIYSVGSTADGAATAAARSAESFSRVPYEIDQSAVAGAAVTATVTVAEYTGPWVPTVGDLKRIDFSGPDAASLTDAFSYNTASGTAAVTGGLTSGDRYTIDAVTPRQPTSADLSQLEPGTASVPAVQVIPDGLVRALDAYTAGAGTAGAKLAAAMDGLRKNGYVSHGTGANEPASRSGHSADRITELLTDQRMIGDAEQYAVTAALMARQLGFPARVVFGFVPETTGGTARIRGRDVSAWIEVDTRSYGWVTIDPNPPVRVIPPAQPQQPASVARPESIVAPPAVEPVPAERQTTPETQKDNPPATNPLLDLVVGVLRGVGATLAVIAVLLAPALVVVAAKIRRRRRRRRARTALAQMSGAWSEFEDCVVDHGFDPPASATRSEIAALAGGARSGSLATVADRAVFSPDEPDVTQVDRLWRDVDDLTASLDAGLTRWQRTRARISLRSLGGYSGLLLKKTRGSKS
jgi:transglutaminase-like putative cysteine protease